MPSQVYDENDLALMQKYGMAPQSAPSDFDPNNPQLVNPPPTWKQSSAPIVDPGFVAQEKPVVPTIQGPQPAWKQSSAPTMSQTESPEGVPTHGALPTEPIQGIQQPGQAPGLPGLGGGYMGKVTGGIKELEQIPGQLAKGQAEIDADRMKQMEEESKLAGEMAARKAEVKHRFFLGGVDPATGQPFKGMQQLEEEHRINMEDINNRSVEYQQRYDDSIKEIKEAKIEPARIFKDPGTVTRMALGAILAGLGAGLTKGKINMIPQFSANMNAAIDRDIAAQKDAIDNQKEGARGIMNLYNANRQKFGDEQIAWTATKQNMKDTMANELDRMAGSYEQKEIKDRLSSAAISMRQEAFTNGMNAKLKITEATQQKWAQAQQLFQTNQDLLLRKSMMVGTAQAKQEKPIEPRTAMRLAETQKAGALMDEVESSFNAQEKDRTGWFTGWVNSHLPNTNASNFDDAMDAIAANVAPSAGMDYKIARKMLPNAGTPKDEAEKKISAFRNIINSKIRTELDAIAMTGKDTSGFANVRTNAEPTGKKVF